MHNANNNPEQSAQDPYFYAYWAGIACITCLSLLILAVLIAMANHRLVSLLDTLYSANGFVFMGSVSIASMMALCVSAYALQKPYQRALLKQRPWKAFKYGVFVILFAHILLPLCWFVCEWLTYMVILFFRPECDFKGLLHEIFTRSWVWGEALLTYGAIVLGSLFLGGLQNTLLMGLYTRKRYLAL